MRVPPTGEASTSGAPIVNGGGGGEGDDLPEPSAGAAGAPSDCDPIVFDDPALELTVRELTGVASGPLTSADVTELVDLVAPAVSSLRGVECLAALETLQIGPQPTSSALDLSPLAGLPKLNAIAIDRTHVESLAPLGTLAELVQLYLFQLPGTLDFAPLARSNQLEMLYLDGDIIDDLSPLGALNTLTYLNLSGCALSHPESISALTSLTDLTAPRVFTDVTPLATLTSLGRLRIGHGPIENFSALRTLGLLQYLDVSATDIDSLEPVASMPLLVNITAGRNRIRDLSPLERLQDLQIVVMVDNLIVDTSPLAKNPALGQGDFVYLDRNPFSCTEQAPSLSALSTRGVSLSSDCP